MSSTTPPAQAPLREVAPRFLSPRDLAVAIGSSESSIKRWADSGELVLARTKGGHRRIRMTEAMRWIRQHHHPIVRPELLGLPDRLRQLEHRPASEQAQALARFLTAGQLAEAEVVLLQSFVGGTEIAALADEVLRPAFATIGELWQHGPEGIAVEHAATTAILHALGEIRRMLPETDGPIALGGSPAGDHYQIGSMLVAMTLQGRGWRTIDLGANVPWQALAAACARHHPHLVWLSLSNEGDPMTTRDYVTAAANAVATAATTLLVGGRATAALAALSPPVALPHVRFTESLAQLPSPAAFRPGK